jgi:putative MATE family efflux protein
MDDSKIAGEAAASAAHEVEEQVEEIGDPEASPAIPSSTLVAHAAASSPRVRAQGDTQGTTREILRLAWPVMLSQVLLSVVSLVDIAMVGRLGPAAQAAVGYATQFFFLGQSALFAIGFACVALMARAIGANDPARARSAMAGSLAVAIVTAVAIATAILAAPRSLLGWLSAEAEVIELCIPYLQLVMGSSVLLAVSLTLESALRANRDTLTPMLIAALVALVKILANLLLIFGAAGFPRLELVGAGLATGVSQIVGVALFALVLARAPRGSPTAIGWEDLSRCRSLLGELVRIAIPGIVERLIMNFALLFYFGILGSYGTIAVATYTVGVRLLSFSWIPGIAYSQAVATLVGQALGAGDGDAAERAGWKAARLALGTAIVLGALGGLAREPLAGLFTQDAATIAALGPFMLCLALAQPFLQLHFTLGGVHRGAGDTWTPMVASTIGNWAFRIPLALLFAELLELPVVWVWMALIFDHLARALLLFRTFRRRAWQTGVAPSARATV